MKRLLAALFCVPLAMDASAAITFVAGSNSTPSSVATRVCAEPSGVQLDDLLIAFVTSADDTLTGTFDEPNGFTSILDSGGTANAFVGNDTVLSVMYRFRGASTIGSTTFTLTGGTPNATRCSIVAYRGVDKSVPFAPTYSDGSHRSQTTNSSGAYANPAITTTNANELVLLVNYDTTGTGSTPVWVAPSGYNLDFSISMSGNANHAYATKLKATAGTETPGNWASTGFTATSDAVKITLALNPRLSGPVVRRRQDEGNE